MADKNLLKQATQKLQDNWSQLSSKDIAKAKGSVEDLVAIIVEKTGEAASSVRERVERIIADVQGRRQKKSFMGRVRGFVAGLLKVVAALAAIAAAIVAGLMFWRKRVERRESTAFGSAEPPTMDQAAALHSSEAPPVAPTAPPDETS
jgi:uncharacterized protein YjbJ (UPF0337 family)